jgi:hypothetical protein
VVNLFIHSLLRTLPSGASGSYLNNDTAADRTKLVKMRSIKLRQAAIDRDYKSLLLILEEDVDQESVSDAMRFALNIWDVEMVKILARNDENGRDGLFVAVKEKKIDIIQVFLDKEVDVEEALRFAAGNNMLEVVQYFLNAGFDSRIVIRAALRHRNLDILQACLEVGAPCGEVFLAAVREEDIPIVKLCVKYATTYQGEALKLAMEQRHTSIVDILLDNKADRTLALDFAHSFADKYDASYIPAYFMGYDRRVGK